MTTGISVNMSAKNYEKLKKKHRVSEKGYFFNPATCSCKNGKYTGSTGNSVVICEEIVEETKTISTKSTPKKTIQKISTSAKCTSTNFYILLAFLLIITALLITVNIYLIKHQSKQKKLLLLHNTSKLKDIGITNIL